VNTPGSHRSDADARLRALDPQTSFIVRAPAGSGKTELLIQRYLCLLARVDEPEEILAITFTRKAATEMRTRVLQTLAGGRDKEPPSEEHRRHSYQLARTVLDRDDARDWGLADQPARMRIGTIDSINSRLARRAPLSVGVMSGNELTEYAEPLYRSAARTTIGFAGSRGETGETLKTLLIAFDNKAEKLETLIASMLARRDQWMHITGSGLGGDLSRVRRGLEAVLIRLVEPVVVAADDRLPREYHAEIVRLLEYAGHAIVAAKPDSALTAWQGVTVFPDPGADNLALWQALANAFLNQGGNWRKRLDKNTGFPTSDRNMRDAAMDLIGLLSQVDGLEAALAEVLKTPEPHYSDQEWTILEALLTVLPLAVATLKSELAAIGQTDYTEISQEARAALGSDTDPTPLALALDYQVKHILLDEFQDTSRSQVDLLRKLTAGWEIDDGRTLFLVGDPMQSIYRFREAEVGQFIHAKKHGVGTISLESLRLEKNFRSHPKVVDWFNRIFSTLMPDQEDPLTGAIEFASSESTKDDDSDSNAQVSLYATPHGDRLTEADQVIGLVKQTFDQWRNAAGERGGSADRDLRIGILVRSRRHANEIVRALRQNGIPFYGGDLETIDEQAVVQDLLALTRAMTHRADRLAWLAVLRSPCCGLDLNDLAALAADDHDVCLADVILEPPPAVSDDGVTRLIKLRETLECNSERIGRLSLRQCVEQTWLELGGPAALTDGMELEWADRFFGFLDSVEVGGGSADNGELLNQLRAFRIDDLRGDAQVEIMTIHKAKGLEFDTVILPGLGYSTRKSERPILLAREIPGSDGSDALILAPLNPSGEKRSGIYGFLWRKEQKLEALELDRLLYVAATRAKNRLFLVAPLRREKDSSELANPVSGTLLERLWPAIAGEFDSAASSGLPAKSSDDSWRKPRDWFEVQTRRLPASWQHPGFHQSFREMPGANSAAEAEEREFEWVSPWARHVGTVVHEWLQRIVEDRSAQFDVRYIEARSDRIRRRLRQLGTETKDLDRAVDRVMDALTGALEDEKGKWILSRSHVESGTEVPVTLNCDGSFTHLVVDRSFVTLDGTRWIVDYKTSTHEGGRLEEFLASETDRYKSQLRRYRDAMLATDDRPTRTALYFPLLREFHEIDVDQ
jgi:ATP-dependent helicase/nuclease subunit A